MTEVVLTTGAIRRAKLQIVTNNKRAPSLSQAGCPSCGPTSKMRSLKEKHNYTATKLKCPVGLIGDSFDVWL